MKSRKQRFCHSFAAYSPRVCRCAAHNNLSSEHSQGVHRCVPRRSAATFSQRGFSLIEMMISITIGLMIVAALVGVLASNSRSSKTNDRTTELQSNGRYALDHLRRELRHAGYRGYSWAEPNTPSGAIAVSGSITECGGAGSGFVQNIRQGIWGANDSNPYFADCLPAANQLRGDVLVIRRVASTPSISLAANTIYFRSTYAMGEMFQGTAAPATVIGTPIDNFVIQEYVYYIGSDNNNANDPALRRVTLKGNGEDCNGTAVTAALMCDEMVVSGIEHMQVQYGRLDTALNTQYYNANGIAGTSTNSFPSDWDDVNSARIWLLARNSIAEGGYTNTTPYPMGDITYPAQNDGFHRQLFTTVVQLRN